MEKFYSAAETVSGSVLAESPPRVQRALWSDLAVVVFFASFLAWKAGHGGIALPHLLFSLGLPAAYFLHPWTRKLFVLGLPMILYGFLFDSFQYIPFPWLEPIRIREIFDWDQAVVGALLPGPGFPLHEWIFRECVHPVLDLGCAFLYGLHVPMAILLAVIFVAARREGLTQRFTAAFLLMNLMAFLTFLMLPSAAPWYVQKFGFMQPLGFIPGDPAGLVRADQILGYPFFGQNYHIAPITFGAVPSMHVGFCVLGWLYARQFSWKLSLVWGGYSLAMGFAALYLQHHYLIDIFGGAVYAVLAWIVVDWLFRSPIQAFFSRAFYYCGLNPAEKSAPTN